MKYMTLSLKSIVESRSEISSQLAAPSDAVLIVRGQPRWLLLKCPCGCNDEIPINLDRRAGKAWRLYGLKDQSLTLFPSVWRDTGCLSHFIIWNGQILLMDGRDYPTHQSASHSDLPSFAKRVKESWPREGWVHYVKIADQLGEIPWDVLDACRYLVHAGVLVEGCGQFRSSFRRRPFLAKCQKKVGSLCKAIFPKLFNNGYQLSGRPARNATPKTKRLRKRVDTN